MKRSVVLGVAIGAIVIAAGGVGYAAYKVNTEGNEQERKAQVVVATNEVDDAIAEVMHELESCDKQWELGVEKGDTANLIEVYTSTRETVTGLKDDVEDIRDLVADIPSDSAKKAYTDVCDELDDALGESLREADSAAPCLDASNLLVGAQDNLVTGRTALNASVQACNADNWSGAKEQAQTAQAQFQAMRDAFGQAAVLSGCPEVEAACPYPDALIEMARQQHELAVLGSKGGVNSYNSQIDKLDTLQMQVDQLSELAADADVAIWIEADDLYGHFQLRAIEARHAWDDAQAMVTAGDV